MNNKLLLPLAALLLIIASGCLSQQTGGDSGAPKLSGIADQQYQISGRSEDLSSNSAGEKAVSSERKIISTASLQLEVVSVLSAFNGITNITVASGGYVSSSSIYDTGNRKNGQVTVRVPTKNFYPAIGQIETLGTVKFKEIRGEDVTEEFIDLSARLDNLKKQEDRLRDILKMASTVKDVLEVEHELERVRGEIERLTGKLNYLNQSIEMSTISVTANEPTPITGEGWGITDALREAVNGFVESVNGIIIFTGYIIPIVIFIIFVILAALGIKRRILPIINK